MALADALAEITADWPRLSAQLSDQQRLDARRLLAAAVHGAPWSPRAVLKLLIGDDASHPAWATLSSRSRRTGAVAADTDAAAVQLRLLLELDDTRDTAAPASWQEVAHRAELRVLIAPMRSVPDNVNGVLALDRGDESPVSPAFQFDAAGELLAAVVEVNRELDAEGDPWGVASWWLAPHSALHAIPADAVRHGRADDVLAAAQATLPDG